MASIDFTDLGLVLAPGDVARGVTSGTSKPNGGSTFVFGMNSLTNTVGTFGKYATPQPPNVNFNPMPKGGDIRGAMIRAASGGLTAWSGFLFLGLGTTDVNGSAYLLGLSDGNPCHIELRKGPIAGGLPDETPGGVNKILRQSTEVVAIDAWVHLRLEMVVNLNNDVILNCYKSSLTNPVTAPVWAAIPGMASFTDDALGINSGSVPLTSGRAGFAAKFSDVTRRFFVDHIELSRQT